MDKERRIKAKKRELASLEEKLAHFTKHGRTKIIENFNKRIAIAKEDIATLEAENPPTE